MKPVAGPPSYQQQPQELTPFFAMQGQILWKLYLLFCTYNLHKVFPPKADRTTKHFNSCSSDITSSIKY